MSVKGNEKEKKNDGLKLLRSLISAFVIRFLKSIHAIGKLATFKILIVYKVSVDEQAGLRLT